jgi:heme-degrading monooxygenase HmoA
MIARVVYGKLRSDADAAERAAAWEQAVDACEGIEGFHGLYFLEPPEGQEGVLMVSFWDSVERAAAAVNGRKLWTGLSGFSLIVATPPRTEYYPVLASRLG